ncbi:MAG TPA: ABC transporter substrate-binding protein [Candidatus Acidoferrum sp.]|nr:ABC transporter substrate-binding protein [Candidatus Acidoferrum sp.]
MSRHDARRFSRRRFLAGAAGTVGLLGLRPGSIAAEPPPETTTLRLAQFTSGCQGPFHVAGELLRAEGFTDVQYVRIDTNQQITDSLAARTVDVGVQFSAPFIGDIDRGVDIVTLGGVHAGCFVLFGNRAVRSVRDLKGKTVSVPGVDTQNAARMYIASMAAYVGLDPARDITWVAHPLAEAVRAFTDGKVDAIMGFPPLAQELRAKKIGHVVVDSTTDRPWSQYFCCMMVAGREFVKKHPVAAKRAVRAIVKATAICAQEPERVARLLVERGIVKQYDYALQTIKELPYARWRDYDSEDTLRFYALRLHEAGMIKSSPQKIIAQGSDLRFINELKKELKG